MEIQNTDPEPLTIKAATSTYVTFGVIWGTLALIAFIVSWKTSSSLAVFALLILVMVFCFTWIAAFKLVLANGVLSYRTLFGGTRSIPLSEIERAEGAIGYDKYSDRLKPPIRLVIQPSSSSRQKAIHVNLKVLRRQDVLRVIKALESCGKLELLPGYD